MKLSLRSSSPRFGLLLAATAGLFIAACSSGGTTGTGPLGDVDGGTSDALASGDGGGGAADGGASGDSGKGGPATATGLEGFCEHYKECGGTYYSDVQACMKATLD